MTQNPSDKPLSPKSDDDDDGFAYRASFGSSHGHGKIPCNCADCLKADYETRQRLGRSIDAQRAVAGKAVSAENIWEPKAHKPSKPTPTPEVDVWARAPNREVTDQQREKASKEKPDPFGRELSEEGMKRLRAARPDDRDRDDGWERERGHGLG